MAQSKLNSAFGRHFGLFWLLLPAFLFLSSSQAFASNGKDEGADSAKAEKDSTPSVRLTPIFEKESLSVPYLEKVSDSLERRHRGSERVRWLQKCLERPVPERQSLIRAIDSLLDGGKVDRQRMRELRILIARAEAKEKETERPPFMLPYGDSPYPAASLLPIWDTRRIFPYAELHSNRDEREVRELRLTAPEWNCGFTVPMKGEMTSPYGERDGRRHHGVDIDLQVGDPVRSAFPGMIRVSRYFRGYGNVVIVRHPNGLETLYAHLHRSLVNPGEQVSSGERIAIGGNSGHSTGSHLHFEVRYKGVSLNPSHFIAFEEEQLMGDTLVLKERYRGYAAYPENTEYHEVKYGDYLYRIAQRYGITVQELCEINGIQRNAMLEVGQRIRIGG